MTPGPNDEPEVEPPNDALIVVPLIRLPSERTADDVKAQKKYIREKHPRPRQQDAVRG
jgi:hypothetical protein